MNQDEMKKAAAEAAIEYVENGMVVGIGTGSTANHFIDLLANIKGKIDGTVASSEASAERLRGHGIPVMELNDVGNLSLYVDGADESNKYLHLIKGGGGALTREKIVALASQREIIVIDESKLSGQLGSHHRVPVEVLPFGWVTQKAYIASLGAGVSRRENPDGSPFETDQGQWILDCDFGPLGDPQGLAANLESRSGIVEHGLFLGLATDVIVAGPGGIRHLRRDQTGSLNGRNG